MLLERPGDTDQRKTERIMKVKVRVIVICVAGDY
jgi:hypothetical protein